MPIQDQFNTWLTMLTAGQQLFLVSGQAPVIRSGDNVSPVTDAALDVMEMRDFVATLITDDTARRNFLNTGNADFVSAGGPSGRIIGRARYAANVLKVAFAMQEGAGGAAPGGIPLKAGTMMMPQHGAAPAAVPPAPSPAVDSRPSNPKLQQFGTPPAPSPTPSQPGMQAKAPPTSTPGSPIPAIPPPPPPPAPPAPSTGTPSEPGGAAIKAAAATPAYSDEADYIIHPKLRTRARDIDHLFAHLIKVEGSDLHLTCGQKPMIRVHGELRPVVQAQPLTPVNICELLAPIMPERNLKQFNEFWDTDFAYEVKDVGRFRSNVFMDRMGPGAVFRHIPSKLITVEDLQLSEHIVNLCYLTKGLVLVTGPTGSGKSTTLCALIDFINRKRKDHIITIEDPIEFVHPNKNCLVNQREVGVHTKGFKAALKAALREDPDIILVGEMRDLETIAIAIETAETGHLVFGTLHTSTAASTVDRIIDQFPADRQEQIRQMLSNSLKGVIAQTLIKTKAGRRTAALEVLLVNPAISNLIREAKTFQIPSIMQSNRKAGMVMLNDALFDLIVRDIATPEDCYMKAIDKQGFADMLTQKGVKLRLQD